MEVTEHFISHDKELMPSVKLFREELEIYYFLSHTSWE